MCTSFHVAPTWKVESPEKPRYVPDFVKKTPICSRSSPWKNRDPAGNISGPGREHIGTRPGTYWELFKKFWQILVLLAAVINATVVQTSPQ